MYRGLVDVVDGHAGVHGRVIRDLRRHGERAGADISMSLLYSSIVKVLKPQEALGRRQTHIVARLQVQGFHLAADVRPSAVKELAQRGHSRFLQALSWRRSRTG